MCVGGCVVLLSRACALSNVPTMHGVPVRYGVHAAGPVIPGMVSLCRRDPQPSPQVHRRGHRLHLCQQHVVVRCGFFGFRQASARASWRLRVHHVLCQRPGFLLRARLLRSEPRVVANVSGSELLRDRGWGSGERDGTFMARNVPKFPRRAGGLSRVSLEIRNASLSPRLPSTRKCAVAIPHASCWGTRSCFA